MATVKEFVDAMIDLYDNHGIYVGTANGELTLDIAGKFYEYEKRYGRPNPLSDTARDYEYLAKCYRNGYDMSKSRAGDCSGQIVGVLRRLGVIAVNQDYNANTLQKLAYKIEFSRIQPGDLLFDTESEDAGHVGVYIGDGMEIDSRGRDVGVVFEHLASYKWKGAGRLDWFEGSIPPLKRNLYYRSNDLMKGEDVRQCQEQLLKKGYNPGKIDGIFGLNTESAVFLFQEAKDLDVDGVVGPKTWNALFS